MNPQFFYDVNVGLRLTYPAAPSFGTEMVLLDDDQVPIYDRVRALTEDDVSSLTAGTVAHSMATAFFGQAEKADRLYLARVTRTATPPAFICGAHTTSVSELAALGTGATFTVTDSESNSTLVTVGALGGITAFSQFVDALNTALAALVDPGVSGLDDATFALDVNGDLVLTMPSGQDDTDPTIAITPSASDTTIAYHLGVRAPGDGTSVEGNPVETLLTAYNAAKILASAYNIAVDVRGGTSTPLDDQIVALAAQIETEAKQMTVVDTNDDAVDAASSADLHSRMQALNYDQTAVVYTEHTDDYPDMCADGAWIPAEPGSRSYGHTKLSGCSASGSLGPQNDLSSTHLSVLEDKGNNFVALTRSGNLFVHRGKTAGGVEKRMMRFKHWLEAAIQADMEALDMNEDLLAFDNETLGAINGILEARLSEGVTRGGLIDYEVTLPKLADFTAQEVSSGDMPLLKCFRAWGRLEAHTFQITGNIGLGL